MLIVISLVSGDKFPIRDTHNLVAEAKFDDELLATDPVPHSEKPQFDQELAWELDKKALQRHRLQRASIKLLLYAVDLRSTAREQVGYVVLDVRSATAQSVANKSFQLLHSKYSQSRPQLHLALYIDESEQQQQQPNEAEQPEVGQGVADDESDQYEDEFDSDHSDYHDANQQQQQQQQNAQEQAPTAAAESAASQPTAEQQQQQQQSQPQQPQQLPGVSEADMYHAAMELELWKESAKEAFESELKKKEQSLVMAFAHEFRRRDHERESAHRRKVAEYDALVEKLQAAIADVEEKERRLNSGQRDLLQKRDDLQRRHDSRLKELQDASARLQADCQQKVDLERARSRQLEEQLAASKASAHDWERRCKEADAALRKQRQIDSDRPEIKLLHSVNQLQMEKSELERKLDQANKAKLHYKSQLGRCLKELATAKQREQEQQQQQLQRQQTELEHMRLRYLAAEEQDLVKRDKTELRKAKEGLDSLALGLPNADTHHQQQLLMSNGNQHVARLVEERDTLLRTGVYSHEDDIIRELERRIHSALHAA